MSFRRQQELLNDSKYRSFANSVDKVLKNFEYSSEWADLISALGKLNKVLQANAKYGAIPKTITVGKRLSQCMHPALPGGVHLKAIDVYDTIFKILGPTNLKLLLSVFSSGLFSLYSYASTPVRPVLLNLFEVHLLPLGKHLQMFLDGLLLGLLPGLEEGSEHFENVNSLLVSISNVVDTTVFYSSVWRCVLSSPSGSVVRVAAVQLILRQFDRGKSMDDQLHFIGNDVETMVQSLCEALRDGNVLTQRSALDILLYCFPLSSLSISQSDIVTLLSSALFVVLRRDMSLNRRLYNWILGTNSNKLQQTSSSSLFETNHFDTTSKSLLYDALTTIITKQSQAFNLVASRNSLQLVLGSEVKLLRVLISLLDKSEIGPHIISDVMVATIRLIKSSLNAYKRLMTDETGRNEVVKRGFIEVKKTSNLFIASFESDFIWMFLSHQFSDACSRINPEGSKSEISGTDDDNHLTLDEIRNVVEMFLEVLSLETYPEIQTSILPDFLRLTFTDLEKYCSSFSLDSLLSVLQMSLKVLERIQPAHPKEDESKSAIAEKVRSCAQAYLGFIKKFIVNKIFNDKDILTCCKPTVYRSHQTQDIPEDFSTPTKHLHETFILACKILVEVACFPSFVRGDLVVHVREWMHRMQQEEDNQQLPDWFEHLLAVSVFTHVLGSHDGAVTKVMKHVSVSAIATVLQLISFTTRIQDTPGLSSTKLPSLHRAQGVVSVVIIPPLTPAHINIVFQRTGFFVKGSALLWKELDDCSSIHEQLTIGRLFLKLYYDCPNDDVETKLLEDITSHEQNHQLSAVVRFCKLWCVMRVLAQDHSLVHESDKTFSRCLFVVVDQLKTHSSISNQATPTNQVTNHTIIMRTVSSWLRECIEEGDICNVVEPYLLLALNPRTHRKPFTVSDNQQTAIDTSSDHHSLFLRNRNARSELSDFSNLLKEMKRYHSQDETTHTSPPVVALNIQEQIEEGKKSYGEILNLLSLQDHESPTKKMEQDEEDNDNITTESSSNNLDNDRQGNSMQFTNGHGRPQPLQSLIHVYQEHFDTSQVLFSLQSLHTIAKEHPNLFIFTACTTSMSSGSYLSVLLQDLMVRHERTLNSGTSFYEGGKLSSKSSMKNQMVIEILITVCMYYIRSSFLNERDLHYSVRNHEIQCTACMLMVTMVKELCSLLRDESATHKNVRSTATMSLQQFAAYLVSIFEAQNVQKSTILSLIATVLTIKNAENQTDKYDIYNAMNHTSCQCGTDMTYIQQWSGGDKSLTSVLFSHLLELTFSIIVLEQTIIPKSHIDKTKQDDFDDTHGNTLEEGTEPFHDDESKLCCQLLHSAQQYDPAQRLASQNVFIATIMEILRIESLPEVHTECVTSLVSVLPCLRTALPHMITPILSQLCKNIVTACHYRTQMEDTAQAKLYPPQYIETALKTLSVIVHDCLLIGDLQTKSAALHDTSTTNGIPQNNASANSTFGNLFGVFTQTKPTKRTPDSSEMSEHVLATRNAVLNQMVRIVSCLSCVWQTVHVAEDKETQATTLLPAIDNNKLLAHNVVQFLGPLSMKYGENLLCSLAVLWDNKSTKNQSRNERATNPVAMATTDQSELLDLLSGVHGFSFDAFLQLVQKSMKAFKTPSKKDVIEENILHLTLCHMKNQKSKTLLESWPTICSIIKEAVAFTSNSGGNIIVLSPRCYFVLLHVLVDFVKVIPKMESKKDQKDLQEAAEKCIEVCNTIAGSCLEQSNWIMRRNLSVIPGPQVADAHITHKKTASQSSIDLTELPSTDEMRICVSETDIETPKPVSGEAQPQAPPTTLELPAPPKTFDSEISHELRFEHSVQSLTILSQVVSHLLDIIYGNEERDKVIPVLASIMANVLPYLRNHNRDNVPSFHACSVFTSSMSGFQHTRRVWRKEILDLFLDPLFFKIPYNSTAHWKVTIDHLMTHDKTTFKEFLSRISFSRGGSATPISIFTNKEQELEQRAMHLKRLAFVIYSSEVDQYHRNLPEIQERLAECLRLYNAPVVMEQVFLCFRVLILRVSPHNMTSLWPSVYTELTHALLQIEQALDSTVDGFSTSNKNKSQNTNSTNGNNASWYSMYLSACKLLDMILCLPSRFIPVFQLYRWCFVNISSDHLHEEDPTADDQEEEEEVFVPYCIRIKNLLNKAKPEYSDKQLPIKHGRPLLTVRKLKSLQQLQLFINTITSQSLLLQTQKTLPLLPSSDRGSANGAEKTLEHIEKQLDKDFLEAMF